MSITLDFKTLIALCGIVALLGGFYYTTQIRLADLEFTADEQTAAISELRRHFKRPQKGGKE